MPQAFAIVALVIIAFLAFKLVRVRQVIIYEYQRGLRYKKGRYVTTLTPGRYWINSLSSTILHVDIRPEFITIQGQDVLSSDGVSLKVSLAAEFQVVDPNNAINKNNNFRTALYLTLQMSLREIVGTEKIDALVENRAGISSKLMELGSPKAADFGLNLLSADVKDIMFSGEMKKAFAHVVKAQKEGQAALERARGETAALRNLANAARMMDDNPNLLHLRALQALADSTGNTLVFGMPNTPIAAMKQNGKGVPPPRGNEQTE